MQQQGQTTLIAVVAEVSAMVVIGGTPVAVIDQGETLKLDGEHQVVAGFMNQT
jgi:hypothetical protein